MKCDNCGGIIRGGDTYCPLCGKEIKSEYKPLQERFKRGELSDWDEDIYYDRSNPERKPYHEPESKPYRRGYDLDEYYPEEAEPESSGSIMLPIILFLLIALLIGFILGIMMFSSNFQAIPSMG